MKLRMALDDKLLDVRLRDRLVSEGKVTNAQVEDYLKSLADEEGNYTNVEENKEPTSTEQ
jgi:hypothetical protein